MFSPPGQASFLSGLVGPIFTLYRAPSASCARGHTVVFVPPFAEEMNKSRHSISQLSAQLVAQGIGVLVFDPYGTGDSTGDFADARWDIWRDDLARVIQYAQQEASRVSLIGLRLGALLALDLLQTNSTGIDRLILWQPPTSGEQLMTQFLRILLAANLGSDQKITTKQLREKLDSGETLEIAGYTLHPQLVAAIDAIKIEPMLVNNRLPTSWFEIVSGADKPIPPGSQKIIDAVQASNRNLEAAAIPGEPFWAIQEITMVPALLDTTVQRLLA